MSAAAPPTGDDDASSPDAASLGLEALGWDAAWADAFAPHAAQGLAPARVAIEFNHLFRLYTGEGELQAQHAGRVLHEAAGRHALAAVGDWVAILPAARGTHRHHRGDLATPHRISRARRPASSPSSRWWPPTSTSCSW